MRYIVDSGGELYQLEASVLAPADLKAIEQGEMLLIRSANDGYEYARVIHRSVDDPENSLDETRYDQAIDGRIYEIEGWTQLDRYVPGTGIVSGEAGQPTVVTEPDQDISGELQAPTPTGE